MYRGVCSAPGGLSLQLLLVKDNVALICDKLVLCQAALQRLNEVQGQGALALDRLPAQTTAATDQSKSAGAEAAVRTGQVACRNTCPSCMARPAALPNPPKASLMAAAARLQTKHTKTPHTHVYMHSQRLQE